MPNPPTNPWNSLEIAKLIASLAMPIAVGCLGIYIYRITKRFEHSQWRHQKVIERRLTIYDSLAPQLNELLCYFTYVGRWKDVDPTTIVAMKREIDRKIYLAQPLFSPEFFNACMSFMAHGFATFQGWGVDAKLRTHFERRKQANPAWLAAWDACFANNPSEPADIRQAYQHLMATFALDIGLTDTAPAIESGRLPTDIK